jgi:hypothetical protein
MARPTRGGGQRARLARLWQCECNIGAADGEPVMAHSRARLHGEVHGDAVHPPSMVDTAATQHNEVATGEVDLTNVRRCPNEGRRRGGRW